MRNVYVNEKIKEIDGRLKFVDISYNESYILGSILDSFYINDYFYNTQDKTFIIYSYQNAINLYIDYQFIYAMISMANVTDNVKNQFYNKECGIGKLIDIHPNEYLDSIKAKLSIVKLVLHNVEINKLFNDKEINKTNIPLYIVSKIYRKTISLYDYLYNNHINYELTEELSEFIDILDIDMVIEDDVFEAVKNSKFYKDIMQIK